MRPKDDIMMSKKQVEQIGKVEQQATILPASVRTTFAKAQEIADGRGERLILLSEVIKALADSESTFSRELKGECIWLGDRTGFKESGRYRIDYENGVLVPAPLEYEDLLPNQKARVWGGTQVLTLFIGGDKDTRRLTVDAIAWSGEVARVVLMPWTGSESEAAALRVPEAVPSPAQSVRDAEAAPARSEKGSGSSEIKTQLESEICALDDVTGMKPRSDTGPDGSYHIVYMRRSNEDTEEKISSILGATPYKIRIIPEPRD
jgi:hypothetical protein